MTDQHRTHSLGNRDLPRVVFAHSAWGASLAECGFISVRAMDTLPQIAAQISLDGLGIISALKYFNDSHRRDPQSCR